MFDDPDYQARPTRAQLFLPAWSGREPARIATIASPDPVVLIRVATTRADIPRSGEGIAAVRGEIGPKITAMHGNSGFAMAIDRSSRQYVGIAAWTDTESLDASEQNAPVLIADLARRLHGDGPSVEVFELVLAQVVKPVRVGYWGRRARLEVPALDLAHAVQRFEETLLAVFDRYDGLASIVLLVDRAAGVLESIVWCDSVQVLRGSAGRDREVRKLFTADVPTANYVELSELEVVIAEMQQLF